MHSQTRIFKILLLVLFTCLATFTAGCSKPLTDAEHIARAREFRDKGDLRTTMIELKAALQQNPKNIEARRLLGEAYLKMGNGAAAEKELRRAIELGLAQEAVALSLAEALQLQGKHQEILDEIDPVPSLPPQDQATLAAYRGDAWLSLGKPDKARTEYQRALELDPNSPLGKLGMAYLAAAERDTDKALSFVDEALQTAPEEGRLWRYKAELHRRRGELEAAEGAYSKAIDLHHRNVADRANRALVRIDLKKFDEAAKDIEILKKSAPKFYLTHFAAGYLKLAQGDTKGAKASLEQALSLNARYPFTYFYLGLIQLQTGELEQADLRLSRFKALFPNSSQAHKALALAKYRLGDFQAARSLLMPVLLSQPEDPYTLNLMANIELASGHPKEGIQYLEKLATLRPESPEIEARLGMGMLAAGLQKQGIELLEKALAKNPDLVQADTLLITTYIREKNFPKARQLIDEMKERMPQHPLPLNLEAKWYLAQGDEAKAEAALDQAWQLDPGHPTTGENLARLAFKNKQLDKARKIYETVLQNHPGHVRSRLRMAELDFYQGRLQDMEKRLTDLIQQRPDLLQPRLELAKYYLQFGQPDHSLTLLEEIRAKYPRHPELLAVLAKAQLEAEQPRRALDTAKALAPTVPGSPLPHYLLAQAHARLGDIKNLRQELAAALKANPRFLPARLAMVKLLALEGKTTETERTLQALAQDYPNHPEVLALRGWWATRQHQPEQAAEFYRKALSQRPSTALVMNLAKALWRAGKHGEAIETLEDWNARHPRDVAVLYLRSGLYQAAGEEEKARQALREILQYTPKNPTALNDLAWLLRKENPKQALEYAEQAYAAAPKSAQIVDTLGMVLLENGHKERALRILKEAASLAPEDPGIRYHLALAQRQNGLMKEAAASLKQALASKRRFPERQQAAGLLKTWGNAP